MTLADNTKLGDTRYIKLQFLKIKFTATVTFCSTAPPQLLYGPATCSFHFHFTASPASSHGAADVSHRTKD